MLLVNQLIGFGAGSGGGIQFVGGTLAAKAGASSGNTTIALNSGLTGGISSAAIDGDLVIAAFGTGSAASSDSRTLAITDGTNPYTLVGTELFSNDTFDANLRVCYKFVSGDTETTFGPTGEVADAGAMAVFVFRGVDLVTPLDVAAQTATGTNTSRADPPSITPTTPGAVVVCIGAAGHNGGVDTFTSSDLSGFQTIGSDDSNDCTLGLGYKEWSSGAFDAAAFGHTEADSTSFAWAALSLALRPAT
jgi:hypothetical protein